MLAPGGNVGAFDEFHWLFPVAAGAGQRLFDGIEPTHLNLVDTTRFGSGIVVLTYAPKQSSARPGRATP